MWYRRLLGQQRWFGSCKMEAGLWKSSEHSAKECKNVTPFVLSLDARQRATEVALSPCKQQCGQLEVRSPLLPFWDMAQL